MDYNDQKLKNFDLKYNFLLPTLSLVLYYMLMLMVVEAIPGLNLSLLAYSIIFLMGLEGIIAIYLYRVIDLPIFFPLLEMGFLWVLLKFFCSFNSNIYLWVTWGLGIIVWLSVRDISAFYEKFNVDHREIVSYNNWKEGWMVEDHKPELEYRDAWKTIKNRLFFLNLFLIILWLIIGELKTIIVLSTTIFLVIQFILLLLVFLENKKLEWNLQEIKFPPLIGQIWFKAVLLLLLVTLLGSLILPVTTGGIRFSEVLDWLNNRLSRIGDIRMEMPQNIRDNREGSLDQRVEREEGSPSLLEGIILFMFLALIAVFVLLAIGALLFLLGKDLGKFRNIFNFFNWFINYLKKLFKALLNFILNGFTRSQNWIKEKTVKREKRRKQKKAQLPDEDLSVLSGSPGKLIYRVYVLMLKYFSTLGESRSPVQTPYEYAEKASERFPGLSEEIGGLTEFYVEEVYSDHSLKKEVIRIIKKYWQRFKDKVSK
ncbi:MAG TPA: DUF4129 domain-containing protein [Halanaerobiales bacterium]|nr:DUF4129 domain-containing protein [Halanaerobiales bacterium]